MFRLLHCLSAGSLVIAMNDERFYPPCDSSVDGGTSREAAALPDKMVGAQGERVRSTCELSSKLKESSTAQAGQGTCDCASMHAYGREVCVRGKGRVGEPCAAHVGDLHWGENAVHLRSDAMNSCRVIDFISSSSFS
jgi:hypothetical protein